MELLEVKNLEQLSIRIYSLKEDAIKSNSDYNVSLDLLFEIQILLE
jgi:hypothetical protein